MMIEPKPMGAAEAALRLMARRGRGDWMVLVVQPDTSATAAAHELVQEMESLGGAPVERIQEPQDAQDLVAQLAAMRNAVVVSGLDHWAASEWGLLDRLRSRLARDERTALCVTPATLERILQEAPNFSSWLGASVVAYEPHAAELTDAERARRLEELRRWSGLSNEDVIARAESGTLPADPEYAEWLVLLYRGDLLER